MDDVEPAVLVWQIAPGHYLYRDKLGITDAKGNPVPIDYPEGIEHSDEFFGDTQIYRQLLQPLSRCLYRTAFTGHLARLCRCRLVLSTTDRQCRQWHSNKRDHCSNLNRPSFSRRPIDC